MTTKNYVWSGKLVSARYNQTRGGLALEVEILRPGMRFTDHCVSWDAAIIDNYAYLMDTPEDSEVSVQVQKIGEDWHLTPTGDSQVAALTRDAIRKRSIDRQASLKMILDATGPWSVTELLARWAELQELAEKALAWIEGDEPNPKI